MNHRTVLRQTTNGTLLLMALAALGTEVWVIDEVLGWNILPDWIEAGAVAGVIVAGTLTLFFLKPCVWEAIRHGEEVVGLVLLRDRNDCW